MKRESQVAIIGRILSKAREPGTLAFILHRVLGIALVAYLFLHIYVISSGTVSSKVFNETLDFFQTPKFLLVDVGLLGAVTFHTLNGIRITLFDLGIGIRRQEVAFGLVLAATIMVLILALSLVVPIFLGE